MGEIQNISKKSNFDNLTDHIKDSNTASIRLIDFRGPMYIYREIENGNISIEKIEENQINLNQN